MKDLRKFLLRNHVTPKWAIFLIDLGVCVFSLVYSSYLLNNFDLIPLKATQLSLSVGLLSIFASAFFFVFQTYDGIIRYSDFHEAIRCLGAVFCSFLAMVALNLIVFLNQGHSFIPTTVLIIYFLVASFLIFGYRLLVKILYNASVLEDANTTPVIMYGTNNGSLLTKTISKISQDAYKVVAYVVNDEKLAGKTLDGVKIIAYQHLKAAIKQYDVKMLFFNSEAFDIKIKNQVVDDCLAMSVKLMNIPPVQSWVQGHLQLSQLQEVKIDELLGRPSISIANPQVKNLLANKSVLITGAAGSIGSEIARQVASMNPSSLIICDQSETGLYSLEYELQQVYSLGSSLKVFLGDVTNRQSMSQLFTSCQPQIVFHAAAYKHVPMMEQHPCEAIQNNVLGTKILADLSLLHDVERFLLISTDKAINPTNIMGASKRITEIYCNALHHRDNDEPNIKSLLGYLPPYTKTKFITTRFGNVLGSNGSVIPRFQQQIASGGPITVTHPDIIRYFMTIQEACSLVLEAVTMGNGGEIFLFDMGEPVRILDLAQKMIRLAGLKPGEDIKIQFTGLRPGEKLYEELLNKEEEVIPTHHKKILIAKVIQNNYDLVKNNVAALIKFADEKKTYQLVNQIKNMVPEFNSSNVIYQVPKQETDVEIKTKIMSL